MSQPDVIDQICKKTWILLPIGTFTTNEDYIYIPHKNYYRRVSHILYTKVEKGDEVYRPLSIQKKVLEMMDRKWNERLAIMTTPQVTTFSNGTKWTSDNPVQPYCPRWQNTQAPVRDTHIVWQETPIPKIPTSYYQLERGTVIREGDIVRCNETGLYKPVEKSYYGLKISGMRDTFRPYSSNQISIQQLEMLIRSCVLSKMSVTHTDKQLTQLKVLKELAPLIAEEFQKRMNEWLT